MCGFHADQHSTTIFPENVSYRRCRCRNHRKPSLKPIRICAVAGYCCWCYSFTSLAFFVLSVFVYIGCHQLSVALTPCAAHSTRQLLVLRKLHTTHHIYIHTKNNKKYRKYAHSRSLWWPICFPVSSDFHSVIVEIFLVAHLKSAPCIPLNVQTTNQLRYFAYLRYESYGCMSGARKQT